MSDIADTIPIFDFGGVEATASPCMPAARQRKFKADFCRELANLERWSIRHHWLPFSPAGLQVLVSDEYRISRSLVPAWFGRRGRMEFPAQRAIEDDAAIMHELVHVYFPNGNRLLAEGLAVYVQTEIGGNPAFPNFSMPLHDVVRAYLPEMMPEFTSGPVNSLEPIRLAQLDAIATPDPLTLSVGQKRYGADTYGQLRVYPIAGSFVQFLIEAHGADKLRTLFMQTPLVPFQREAGSPERWIDVYGRSLTELENDWRSLILSGAPRSACDNRAVNGERKKAARPRSRLSKKV
jgi:hypothetical protein